MRLRIYGYSDDIIEIDKWENNHWVPFTEIDCYYKTVTIQFEDGTIIRCGYPKRFGAIWWIAISKSGTADYSHTACVHEDDEIYSDVFIIDSNIKRVTKHNVKKKLS